MIPTWALELVTPPAEEPVTIADLRRHLRLDDTGEDHDDVVEKAVAAREEFEHATRRQLVTATWRLICDRFPRGIDPLYLPRPPLQSVSLVRYRHPSTGVWTTMDAEDYVVGRHSTPGTIRPAYGECWPSARREPGAVEVTFVCGYGGRSAVPALARNAIKLLAGAWYAVREEVVVGTIVAQHPAGFQRIVERFDPLTDFTPYGS